MTREEAEKMTRIPSLRKWEGILANENMLLSYHPRFGYLGMVGTLFRRKGRKRITLPHGEIIYDEHGMLISKIPSFPLWKALRQVEAQEGDLLVLIDRRLPYNLFDGNWFHIVSWDDMKP